MVVGILIGTELGSSLQMLDEEIEDADGIAVVFESLLKT